MKSTRNVGIKFVRSDNTDVVLRSYVDSDFANNVIDRKSITGFLIKINHNIVAWKTKKQNVVTLSSAESEYVALSLCVTESQFLGQLLEETLSLNVYPIIIYEDNQSTVMHRNGLYT